MAEIAEPDGAVLLDVCSNLRARETLDFKQAVRLDTGAVQFTYNETIEGTGGGETAAKTAGRIIVPGEFQLVLAPFLYTDARPIKAKLRWRVARGDKPGVSFFYKLERPDAFVRDAVEFVTAVITKATGLEPVHGRWEEG